MQLFDLLFDIVAEVSGVQIDDRAVVNGDDVPEQSWVSRGTEAETGQGVFWF